MTPESGTFDLWGTPVSAIQKSDVAVNGNKITGTLKYLDEGQLVTDWGEGYFLCMHWTDPDTKATSLKVGLVPSVSSGMVECLNDPDRNGVFKVTDKDTQVLRIVQSATGYKNVQNFDLSGLTLEA